jgi:hypothetical protein
VSIFNRRNAAIGWLTWSVGKRVLKQKARGSVPSVDTNSKKPNRSAIALAAAGAVGVLAFRRRRSGGDSPPT